MARAGAEAGLSIFGSSDHAPAMPGTCSEMYFCNFSVIPRELFGVRLLMGCELNIIDFQGTVDLAPWLLERLDYGIASIHDLCFPIGTREENTAAAIGAMKIPFVQIIGHPRQRLHSPLTTRLSSRSQETTFSLKSTTAP